MQYKAALAITGAVEGTSRDKVYQEIGPDSLKSRRWYKSLSRMFKIMKEKTPAYLINLVPKCERTIRTKNNSIPTFNCQTVSFKYYFFPSALNDWFNLDSDIRIAESFSSFKSSLLSLISPVQRSIHNIFNPTSLKLCLA